MVIIPTYEVQYKLMSYLNVERSRKTVNTSVSIERSYAAIYLIYDVMMLKLSICIVMLTSISVPASDLWAFQLDQFLFLR